MEILIGTIGLFVSLIIYFFPTIVALLRNHNNLLSIGMTNFFLGWTGLGWIGAIIWACSSNVKPPDKMRT